MIKENDFSYSCFYRQSSPTDSCTLATHACHRLKFDSILKKNDIDFVAVDELGTDSGPRNLEKLEVQVDCFTIFNYCRTVNMLAPRPGVNWHKCIF